MTLGATPLLEDERPSPTRIAEWSVTGEEEDELSPPGPSLPHRAQR